ncbi:MAG: hypothetical protein PF488_01380 [Patescibacteria group bacterium]|jgi:hypothetical protein|nr:hypothetical protein [Patescibacteria group bacterium]
MSINYSVDIEKYATKHFIKSFEKKYNKAWDITLDALKRELMSFDILLSKSIAEIITERNNIKICKLEFKVAGTNKSRHGSGNRCIICVNNINNLIKILLLYHKSHLGDGNETAKWKQMIKDNYPEYNKLV